MKPEEKARKQVSRFAKEWMPAAALGGLLMALISGIFLWMLPRVAEREVAAACTALRPLPRNGVLGDLPVQLPGFTAQDQNGNLVSSESLRGKVVFLNFWASWCNVCALEKPTIRRLEETLGDDLEIVTLASDLDWKEIQESFPKGPPFRVLLDPPKEYGTTGPVAKSLGVEKLPESFLIDRDGLVRRYYANKRDWSSGVAQTCLRSYLDES